MADKLVTPLEFLAHAPVYSSVHAHEDTTGETVLLIKLPRAEAEACRGARVQLQLVTCPTGWGPVVALQAEIFDQPGRPLHAETLFNIGQPRDAENLRRLGSQDRLIMCYYDEQTCEVHKQAVRWRLAVESSTALSTARRWLEETPIERRDFERARREFMEKMPW